MNPLSELTPAQLNVLHWLAEGLTNRELATRLVVAEQTIKFHISDVFKRLGVRNRVEAAVIYHVWCDEPGYIRPRNGYPAAQSSTAPGMDTGLRASCEKGHATPNAGPDPQSVL